MSLAESGLILSCLLGGGGLWSVLRVVVRGRVAVALERERSRSNIDALERLPPGGRLSETDSEGRSRLITLPQQDKEGRMGQHDRSFPEPPERARAYDTEICELFREEAGRLRGTLINAGTARALVDDIVQDSFLAVRSQWPRIRDYRSPRGYLFRVAINLMRKRMKSQYARTEPHSEPHKAASSSFDEAALDLLDWQIALSEAIRKLPLRQRETVLLHYYGDFPITEVAHILGIAEGSVKRCLFDARATLRELLGDSIDGEETP